MNIAGTIVFSLLVSGQAPLGADSTSAVPNPEPSEPAGASAPDATVSSPAKPESSVSPPTNVPPTNVEGEAAAASPTPVAEPDASKDELSDVIFASAFTLGFGVFMVGLNGFLLFVGSAVSGWNPFVNTTYGSNNDPDVVNNFHTLGGMLMGTAVTGLLLSVLLMGAAVVYPIEFLLTAEE